MNNIVYTDIVKSCSMETMIINQFVILLTSIPFGLSVLLSYKVESETKKK